ncbi:MAG: apolipoprotein N-acyltransferase [Candidatus Eremiobacteraeota bacterium]|nr:apolipoprotein N-acyltransferase [Candidatus Eremiobacteraeota bacterium]
MAVLSAALLATAFPKLGWAWTAPFALAGLFWSAFTTPAPVRAFAYGYVAGLCYFAIMFSWFGETAAPLLGPWGFILILGPAAIEAVAFGATFALASFVFARAPGAFGPLGAAAAFTACEWLRSIGAIGAPFAQVGYTQVDGPFAALAAFGGSYFVTFVVAALGAFVAAGLIEPADRIRDAVWAIVGIIAVTAAANAFWPARHVPPPTIPVAAIQGNIKQDVKWNPETFEISLPRYLALTNSLAAVHPVMFLWPETVMTIALGDDSLFAPQDVRAMRAVREKFSGLARRLRTTLVVGSLELASDGVHNALFVFGSDGTLQNVYRKRQLVPFAEGIPWTFLTRLPLPSFAGRQAFGTQPAVVTAGALRFAPLICWESAFADLMEDQLRRGANLLAIATDDGWFGETAGPYQHAQIAQMRAIESGRWVLRAAATGVSGIIAPNGRWTQRAGLDVESTIAGFVGAPVPTVFARIGPTPIGAAAIVLYLIALLIGSRPRTTRRS